MGSRQTGAADMLLARPGPREGADDAGFPVIRIDRDGRNLQSETLGLKWRGEFVDAAVFDCPVAGKSGSRLASRRDESAVMIDGGIYFGPNGERLAETVFIGDSTAPIAARAVVMKRIAAVAIR